LLLLKRIRFPSSRGEKGYLLPEPGLVWKIWKSLTIQNWRSCSHEKHCRAAWRAFPKGSAEWCPRPPEWQRTSMPVCLWR
jgi:hypothetical protein